MHQGDRLPAITDEPRRSQNPMLGDTKHGPGLISRYASVLSSLTAPSQQVLADWLATLSREEFAVRLVTPAPSLLPPPPASVPPLIDTRHPPTPARFARTVLHGVPPLQ